MRKISDLKLQIANGVRTNETIYCNTVCPSLLSNLAGYLMAANFHWIRKGPVIRFLSDNIRQLGGDLSSHNVYCRRCTNRKAGGFDPEYGILICANEMRDQGHVEDTLAHEMVHAYDHLRFKVDWSDNLRHAACTEV